METVPGEMLRIIDANLNRIGEGLRFLEELSRLVLNDAALSRKLKDMRHRIVRSDWPQQRQLLQARDAAGDVGANLEVTGEEKQRELPAAMVANARRVQEAMRVIEELAKVPGVCLDADKFKLARFELYTLERTLLSRLLRQDKTKKISGLYVIIDTNFLRGRSHLEVARQVISGGTKAIQLRDKTRSVRELLPIAQQLQDLCTERNVLFIVNDYLDLALAADADGLHVGFDDLPVKVARRLLPIDKVLGSSVRTVDEAAAAQAEGADYVGVSSIFPTTSKAAEEVVGLEKLRQIKEAVTVPVVAIGGINQGNAAQAINSGADSVAVISAVMGAEDAEKAAREIAEMF